MIEKVNLKTPSRAIVRKEKVIFFNRGRLASYFFSPNFGLILAPSNIVINEKEAHKLVECVEELGVKKNQVYQTGEENPLLLKQVGKNKRDLFFCSADVASYDRQVYVLPETLPPFYFRGKGIPREYYYDSIVISPKTSKLVREIEISDESVADFVAARENSQVSREKGSYLLVYHNYRDYEEDKIKLKADALVYVRKEKQGILGKDAVYIFVHRWPGSTIKRIPLEMVIEEHPDRVVASADEIKMSRRQYEGIYQKFDLKETLLPFEEIRKNWPFPINKTNLFELRKPKVSIREKINLYKKAIVEDNIFGLAAIGSLFHNAGKGLIEGALLYEILNLAQNELKVAALIGFATKTFLAFYLLANSRAAAEVENLEAKERLGNELNKQFPLWEMGAHRKTVSSLIRRYFIISLSHLAASLVFIQLFPPIFSLLWGFCNPIAAATIFVGGYLLAELLNVTTDAYEAKNSFKLAENRLREHAQFKKTFWTVMTFHDNLEIGLNQTTFLMGFCLVSLTKMFLPFYIPAVGIALGILGLFLCGARFFLPIFGRIEKTELEIGSAEFLRQARTLKFSKNISLELGEDKKIEVISQEHKEKTIIPDFEKWGIKLKVSGLKRIKIRKNWLGKIFPFSFLQKTSMEIKTDSSADPEVVFKIYGHSSLSPEKIKENFIENSANF